MTNPKPEASGRRPRVEFDIAGGDRPTTTTLTALWVEISPAVDAALEARGWRMHQLVLDCSIDMANQGGSTSLPVPEPEGEAVLEVEIRRLREALGFYAQERNWESVKLGEVPIGEPNEGAQAWKSGPAQDGGRRARAALNG